MQNTSLASEGEAASTNFQSKLRQENLSKETNNAAQSRESQEISTAEIETTSPLERQIERAEDSLSSAQSRHFHYHSNERSKVEIELPSSPERKSNEEELPLSAQNSKSHNTSNEDAGPQYARLRKYVKSLTSNKEQSRCSKLV